MLKFLLFLLAPIVVILFLLPDRNLVVKPLSKISGIVVPHHDLVKAQRAEFFDVVAKQIKPPETVIIVAPNHYEVGKDDIQTTDKIWNLSNGTLEPNMDVLVSSIEASSFQNEHG